MDTLTITKNTITLEIQKNTRWTIEFCESLHESALSWSGPVLFVIDEGVSSLFEGDIRALTLPVGTSTVLTIHASEETKSLQTVDLIVAEAQRLGMAGNGLMVAIGGGVVSDVVGYAASIYRRGVAHIRIPTTLLAQIDASIGIKSGLNGAMGQKNLLGTFHPAHRVIICSAFLRTLSPRQVAQGLAEILKLAVPLDKCLFNDVVSAKHVLKNLQANWNHELTKRIIRRAVIRMERGLMHNYYEHDQRRQVAFAHDVAHLLESLSHYRLAHGEAVAINIALSCTISVLMGRLTKLELERVLSILEYFELPLWSHLVRQIDRERLLDAARSQRRGSVNYVIPTRIGACEFIEDVTEQLLVDAYEYLEAYQSSGNGLVPIGYDSQSRVV